ncbi:hypothetical protein [Rubellicoccus peritrichatus]|uniref:Uncharacterized protein n=1 Tax=Rubellicoccus peritrichatus TaxID=3080537 RepID=A0AAQ3LD32_9BACT|nr:hypothetical protein [Puniceicoccus sp. CR14]WOO41680.1 hypothetical protein RZN69_01170 [Puniceicoccus sp. CR14]
MSEKHRIELPAPTYWPMITALGVTLLLAGFVTHWFFSFVGLVLGVRGAIGWVFDVFPTAKLEIEEVEIAEGTGLPVVTTARKVSHLSQGVGGHRVRFPEKVHPMRAGIKGGLLGGAVMAVMAMAYGFIAEGSLWWPVNLLAAIALPSLQDASVETLKQFSALGLLIGTIAHVLTSCFVGLLLAAALPMFPRYAFVWAGLLSPMFWSALFYASVEFIDPAMAKYVSWPWFIACQFSFALVAGYYIKKSEKIETLQTYPIADRAGLEHAPPPEDKSDD